MDNLRSTWAEIDLTAIKNNIREVKALLKTDTKLMVIVKANGYGHGMLEVARVCAEVGIDYLGVASLDEALTLRDAGIKSPILVLGYIPPENALKVLENDIAISVFDFETALEYSSASLSCFKEVKVHIKVDTGMGRLGILADSKAVEFCDKVYRLPGVKVEGIFTHFAVADSIDKSYTYEQIKKFNNIIKELEEKGIYIPIKHSSNSAGILDVEEAHFDMVRAGIITYGLYPSDEVQKEKLNLIPAMTFKTKVSSIKNLSAGSSVSYGRTFIAEKDMIIATVPVGYADGYSRLLSNKAKALINGTIVPLIGNVCMDQCMFDVSMVEGIKVGDEVILFGKHEYGITADSLANIMGTINYEIICSISSRVPRVYIE